MPGRYRISASYTLTTEVEPDGRLGGIENDAAVLDYGDGSSFGAEYVRCDGGEVSFEVEADSEDDARNSGNDLLGSAYYSGDGMFEWEIDNWSINEVEEIVPPMDLAKAMDVIRAFVRAHPSLPDEQRAAFVFVLDTLTP